jgi:hypothetical protein
MSFLPAFFRCSQNLPGNAGLLSNVICAAQMAVDSACAIEPPMFGKEDGASGDARAASIGQQCIGMRLNRHKARHCLSMRNEE